MDAIPQIITDRFLLELVLKGTLIIAAAFAITFMLRRASASLRHAVWSLAFAGLLLLPLASLVMPAWQVHVPAIIPAAESVAESSRSIHGVTAPPHEAVRSERADVGPDVASVSLAGGAADLQSAESESSIPWAAAAGALWAVGAVFLLIRLATTLGRLAWMRRGAEQVTSDVWQRHVRALTAQVSLRRPIRMYYHEDVLVPMTYGAMWPVVFLPKESDNWSEAQKRATLMHEILHVKRCDQLIHVLALTARALHWFNPLAWSATKRLVIERERACDDGVLNEGVASASYADHLLGMARRVLSGREAPVAALAMARPSELHSRILAILDDDQPRRAMSGRRLSTMAASAAAVVLLLAAVQPAPEMATTNPFPVSPAQLPVEAPAGDEIERQQEPSTSPQIVVEMPNEPTPETVSIAAPDTTSLEAKKRAIHAIAELPAAQGLPLLREIAETHEVDELRETAIFWIGQTEDEGAADLLLSFARNDANPDIQRKAVFSLSELDEDGVPGLLEIARSHPNDEIRAHAVFWLGETGGRDVAEQLRAFALNDESLEVQKKALFALAEMQDGEGVDDLIDLARTHPNAEVRSDAVFWLGESGDARAADVLMDIVNQP